MDAMLWQVGHQKAKNSMSWGRPVAATTSAGSGRKADPRAGSDGRPGMGVGPAIGLSAVSVGSTVAVTAAVVVGSAGV
jgi:hypothetical protein